MTKQGLKCLLLGFMVVLMAGITTDLIFDPLKVSFSFTALSEYAVGIGLIITAGYYNASNK